MKPSYSYIRIDTWDFIIFAARRTKRGTFLGVPHRNVVVGVGLSRNYLLIFVKSAHRSVRELHRLLLVFIRKRPTMSRVQYRKVAVDDFKRFSYLPCLHYV